eukprot:s1685_g6.t1
MTMDAFALCMDLTLHALRGLRDLPHPSNSPSVLLLFAEPRAFEAWLEACLLPIALLCCCYLQSLDAFEACFEACLILACQASGSQPRNASGAGFASEAWPAPGLGGPRSASSAFRGLTLNIISSWRHGEVDGALDPVAVEVEVEVAGQTMPHGPDPPVRWQGDAADRDRMWQATGALRLSDEAISHNGDGDGGPDASEELQALREQNRTLQAECGISEDG